MEHCRWCGASVSPRDTICPECGTLLRRENRTCRRCRKEIRSGLAVCPYCGEDLLARRIPWKIVGALGGIAAVLIVGFVALSMIPVPFDLPFLAKAPTATPTEVVLPPTPTATATPRPPTATPTRTPTFTPVITETATLEPTSTIISNPTATPQGTATPLGSPTTLATDSPTPTSASGFLFVAPRLVSPADESEFSSGSTIELTWEPVGVLGENQWYEVSVSYTGRDGTMQTEGNWRKETSFQVSSQWYDDIMLGEREVYWNVVVKSGPAGASESRAVSPTSETWMFRWD
jgi:RNA polymerase subunit RPABC4/transcription elongation factor Spt4